MKRVLAAFVVIATAFGTAAVAGNHNHRAAHVVFWVPDSWSIEGDDASQLTVADPRGEVALLFVLKDHHDMKAAIATIDDTIATIATDVKVGAQRAVNINGMEGVAVDGTGRAGGKHVELSVLIVRTPANKYLMIFGVLESAHKHDHDAELAKMLASLRPVR
ncbi:MAG TPA: hypothetical protein VLX92_28925 [Kofleriaceae bacterium]|nr:hypothetical protein [Kofleriaceae bacterium]